MTYQGLTELYYKYPDAYEAEYERRFNGPFTKHLPFLFARSDILWKQKCNGRSIR